MTATHVTIREVAMRDGLQIEDPISTDAKIELLEAIVATGVTEVEATAFVSPSKVPALADAPDIAGNSNASRSRLLRPGRQPQWGSQGARRRSELDRICCVRG